MKTSPYFLALILSIFILVGCSKENITNTSNPDNNELSIENFTLKTGTVTYSIETCELPNGKCGAQCRITTNDDDCCLQTECKGGDKFAIVLGQNYSQPQIDHMTKNPTPIKDPILRKALKEDGFCLKY